MLVSRLPMGYRTAAAWGAPQDAWSREAQLLAGVFDAIRHLDYVLRMAYRDPKGAEPEPPAPLPRPGIEPAEHSAPPSLHQRFRALRSG